MALHFNGLHYIESVGDVWNFFIVLYCIVLYCIVLYCNVLHCIVMYFICLGSAFRNQVNLVGGLSAISGSCLELLYCIVLYCIVLYCIVLYLSLIHI